MSEGRASALPLSRSPGSFRTANPGRARDLCAQPSRFAGGERFRIDAAAPRLQPYVGYSFAGGPSFRHDSRKLATCRDLLICHYPNVNNVLTLNI